MKNARFVWITVCIGVIVALFTVWYGISEDIFKIPIFQSPDWSIRANRIALAGLLLTLEAIFIAGVSVLYVWRTELRKDYEFRIYFLKSLLFEMRTNWAHICHRVPINEEDMPSDFWDPGFQEFPMRDDACTYAVTEGQAKLRLSEELFEVLMEVSAAVRFVNHQTNEIFAFRFNSPEMLAKISNLVRERDDAIDSLMAQSSDLNIDLREYANELAFRHWAIHYHGYTRHLGPALRKAIPTTEREIAILQGLSPKTLPPVKDLEYEKLQYKLPVQSSTAREQDLSMASNSKPQ